MDTENLTPIDHVTIIAADLDQAIQWYTTSFVCETIYKSKTLAVIQFQNIKLVISLPSDQRPHVGFLRKDAGDFGELREQSDCCTSTFIADPTGNPVELVSAPCEGTPT